MQNEPSTEYRRRLRIFRPLMWLTLLIQIASVGAYFAGLLPVSVSGAAVIAFVLAAGLPVLGAIRWVMAVYPAPVLTPQGEVDLAVSKRRFVERHGTYGFGLLWGVTMAVWTGWDEFHVRPASVVISKMVVSLVVWIPMGLLTGRLWGAAMWRAFTPPSRPRPSSEQ